MTYYADPQNDLPVAWKPKRVVVYAQGLKIYGQIPYILQRRLQAKFISNSIGAPFGSRIVAPSLEDNYTIVRWRRQDGTEHDESVRRTLLEWLYSDSGFNIAVASKEYFFDDLDIPNMWQSPPHVFVPDEGRMTQFLLLASGNIERAIEELR